MKLISTFHLGVDTAAVYGNEEDIGIALKKLLPKYKLKRQDIFITSKLGLFEEPSITLYLTFSKYIFTQKSYMKHLI